MSSSSPPNSKPLESWACRATQACAAAAAAVWHEPSLPLPIQSVRELHLRPLQAVVREKSRQRPHTCRGYFLCHKHFSSSLPRVKYFASFLQNDLGTISIVSYVCDAKSAKKIRKQQQTGQELGGELPGGECLSADVNTVTYS